MRLLLVLLVLALLFAGLPSWGYHSYGWGPSGILGVVLIIVVVYLLLGGL